jgi:FKBP-type peptidyl-prolyl cis-trans isomerase SlyD
MRFEADTPDGPRMVTVARVTEKEALVDANHPMAGLDLNFDIQVRSVRESSGEERAQGQPREAEGCLGWSRGCGDCGCHCSSGTDCRAPADRTL